VAKIGRNQPCPCGSKAKAKRCCGTPRGPSPDELARVFLDTQAAQWAPLLADYSDDEFDELAEEMIDLPEMDLSLQLPLPRLLPPPVERMRQAIADNDPRSILTATPAALAAVDTPTNREQLARRVLALHDDNHQIACDTTALAITDLAYADRPALLLAALYHALTVTTGTGTTPSGLLVATRTPAA
jgi:hypothetical protein